MISSHSYDKLLIFKLFKRWDIFITLVITVREYVLMPFLTFLKLQCMLSGSKNGAYGDLILKSKLSLITAACVPESATYNCFFTAIFKAALAMGSARMGRNCSVIWASGFWEEIQFSVQMLWNIDTNGKLLRQWT